MILERKPLEWYHFRSHRFRCKECGRTRLCNVGRVLWLHMDAAQHEQHT